MVHVHRFFQSAELLAAIRSTLAAGKTRRTCLVLIQPTGDLPPELKRDFAVLDHPLPSREELDGVAKGVATEQGELPEEMWAVLDAAAGLTRSEAENAFALSLVRHGKLDPDPLWELKAKQLTGSGPLSLHRNGPGFQALGGLNALKDFCRSALTNRHPHAEPKGVLCLGPPGTGKSAFAKALGSEVGRPTLSLDIGGLMGSLVGSVGGEHPPRLGDGGGDVALRAFHRRAEKSRWPAPAATSRTAASARGCSARCCRGWRIARGACSPSPPATTRRGCPRN